jgi:hypothetical protein
MKTMRYLIICKDSPFYSEWLMQPDWDEVVMIVDIVKDVFIKKENDRNILTEEQPYNWTPENLIWQEINFDHL